MDTRRFSKIRNLNDIKLEKERLRYEILLAENRLTENFQSVEDLISIPSFFSRVTYGFEVAHTVYQRVRSIIEKFSSWKRKKKKKKSRNNDEYYDED